MIRRDYILRMIEQFLLALSKIKALKRGELWQETAASVNEELQRLAGKNAEAIARLSETEILALLMKGEPTQVIHTKMLMMVALLKDAGDAAVAQDRVEESREFYLKGLHLLMNALESSEAAEIPEFVPKLEELRCALESDRLPLATQARLMRHYEAIGDFAKAEDALFAMIENEPDNRALLEFGSLFYERLLGRSDGCLEAGNLPRSEVEAGLADLRHRKRVAAE